MDFKSELRKYRIREISNSSIKRCIFLDTKKMLLNKQFYLAKTYEGENNILIGNSVSDIWFIYDSNNNKLFFDCNNKVFNLLNKYTESKLDFLKDVIMYFTSSLYNLDIKDIHMVAEFRMSQLSNHKLNRIR